ncbi:trypsin-like serine peptidase [Silicimonas sp. MF1-12-2]|uniref:trypsin-like serine peptidase n=1 Tax=Silicimonas sp. MF1-12-2 TaxID=3384793 RepID=UPI0039B53724
MRRLFASFGAVLLLTQGLAAQDREEATGLRELMTAYEASGWEAVGLISIGAGGMCTGALIETNVVLTAAHCLFDARDGSRIDPEKVKFHAGWRNGRSTASRNVRRAIVHPDYVFTGPNGDLHVANDIALLELESEIRLSNITPYATGNRPRKGQNVGVVSYAHDRASSPSLQRVCYVLARQRGALVLSCEVDFGSSGAPIFVEVDGAPTIVSVVSAKAEVQGRPVSLGTNLEKPLSELKTILRTGGGMTAQQSIEAKTIRSDQTRVRSVGSGGGGAKFLRP